MRWLRKLFGRPARAEAPVLSEDRLRRCFVGARESALWGGVLAVVAQFEREAVALAANPQLRRKETAMALGVVSGMQDLREELERQADEATRAAEEVKP